MEYRIVKLTWTSDLYAVIHTNACGGQEYVAKYLDKATAQRLYDELITKL